MKGKSRSPVNPGHSKRQVGNAQKNERPEHKGIEASYGIYALKSDGKQILDKETQKHVTVRCDETGLHLINGMPDQWRHVEG